MNRHQYIFIFKVKQLLELIVCEMQSLSFHQQKCLDYLRLKFL